MNRLRVGAAIVESPDPGGRRNGANSDAVGGVGPSRRVVLGSTAFVIALCTLVAGGRLLGSYAFLNDDIVQFERASRTGFSSDLLLMDMAQHFAPLNRIGHYLMFTIGDVNPQFGAVLSTGLIAGLLVVTAWLTYELGMSLIRRLLVLAATGTAISVLESAVWNDAALHILLALIATYLVAAMHLRGIRTRSYAWHVASVATFAVGLLTQERAAFALPLVILLDLFILWRDEHLTRRLRRLRAVGWPLLAMASIGGLAGFWIQRTYVSANANGPAPVATARTAVMALSGYQFPQLAGFQPANPPAGFMQVVVLVVVLACCCGLIVLNRRNGGPILFFFAVFALYWGFLFFSPMIGDGAIQANASRLHNAVYVTVPAYVAVFSLEASPRLASAVHNRLSRWREPVVGGTVVAVVLLVTFLAGNAFTAGNWSRYSAAHEFWQGAVDSENVWTQPNLTLVPLQVPLSVASDWAVTYGREEFLLPLLAPGWSPGDLTDDPVVLTPEGQVRSVALEVVSGTSPTPVAAATGGPSCLKPGSYDDTFRFVLDRPTDAGPVLARMNYTSDLPGQLRATPTGAGADPVGDWNVNISTGTHEMLVALPLERVESFELDHLSPGSTLCVNSLDVVRPVFTEPDGSCTLMDRYGTRTAQTTCPAAA